MKQNAMLSWIASQIEMALRPTIYPITIARQRGDSKYLSAKPCKECNGVIRFTKSSVCVSCNNGVRRRGVHSAKSGKETKEA